MKCEHFEREGLARIEAGKPDPHVDDCADCQAARATYLKLTEALADVGADLQPRAGWQDEVLAKVRRPAPASSRKGWWFGAGLGAALAAAAVLLLITRPTVPATGLARVAGGATVRGGEEAWKTDDTLVARSRVAGGAVWVYRDEERVLGCDADHLQALAPADDDKLECVRHARGVRASMRTRLRGAYQVFMFKQPPGTSAPTTFDEAAALVVRDRLAVERKSFEVR